MAPVDSTNNFQLSQNIVNPMTQLSSELFPRVPSTNYETSSPFFGGDTCDNIDTFQPETNEMSQINAFQIQPFESSPHPSSQLENYSASLNLTSLNANGGTASFIPSHIEHIASSSSNATEHLIDYSPATLSTAQNNQSLEQENDHNDTIPIPDSASSESERQSSDKIPPARIKQQITKTSKSEKSLLTAQSKLIEELRQKKQADRAARNRESSRRAREKAKKKYQALELDNLNLREAVRSLLAQNENLQNELRRVRERSLSCEVCKKRPKASKT